MRNNVDKTAKIMDGILRLRWWFQDDMRDAIQAQDGNPRSVHSAAKVLRDHGIPVVTEKAGVWSRWRIAQTPQERHEYQQQVLREMYSQNVSWARATSMCPDANTAAVTAAIAVGLAIGKTHREIIVECEPLKELTGA